MRFMMIRAAKVSSRACDLFIFTGKEAAHWEATMRVKTPRIKTYSITGRQLYKKVAVLSTSSLPPNQTADLEGPAKKFEVWYQNNIQYH